MYYIISPDFDECITYVHMDALLKNSNRSLTFIKENALCRYNKEIAYKIMNEFIKKHDVIGYHLYVVNM